MGRYSDSDDDRSYRKKKKHRSRSRSVGSESSHSSKYSKNKKSKKAKHHHRSRSRSKSSERYKRSKRRSASRDRSRSNSRSKGYRSRRSRSSSRTRSRRSRSNSRSKRSRSRSRSKYTSKRGKSRSRSRERSKRSSPSRSRSSKSVPDVHSKKLGDPCSEVEGFDLMTPAEQAKVRMKLALRAAAAADEKLKEMEGTSSTVQSAVSDPASAVSTMSFEDHQKRIKAIEEIENEGFSPAVFKSGKTASSKTSRNQSIISIDNSHDNAIFGSGNVITQPTSISGGRIIYSENINLAHSSLYESMDEKMDSWCKKLAEFRRKKLEGDAM